MRNDQWIGTAGYTVQVTKEMIENMVTWEEFVLLSSDMQNEIILDVANQVMETTYIVPIVQSKTTLLNNY